MIYDNHSYSIYFYLILSLSQNNAGVSYKRNALIGGKGVTFVAFVLVSIIYVFDCSFGFEEYHVYD